MKNIKMKKKLYQFLTLYIEKEYGMKKKNHTLVGKEKEVC